MKTATKKGSRMSNNRGIKHSISARPKSSQSVRFGMKDKVKVKPSKDRLTTIEQEYVRLFPVLAPPSQQCFFADDYNLQQPSALKYVPSTTNPNAEV